MTKDVFDVQRFYPQIYLACHRNHVRATSTDWGLSAHDSAVLGHLDRNVPTRPRDLARHLGVASSTLSATLSRLESLGHISNVTDPSDGRRRELRLTARGAEALSGTSVLEAARVRDLLARLSSDERAAAIHGLALLARAARELQEER